MRIGLGIVTLAAGVAASTMWFVPSTVESGLAVVSEIGAGGVASLSSSHDKFGSQRQAEATAATSAEPRFFGSALPVTTARPSSVEPASAAATTNSWTTDVVIYAGGAREQGSAPARVLSTNGAIASKTLTRQEVARALQAELKRVGCYLGEVDGEWGPASRRSLRAFIEQVNSGLSGDEPDLIQLTLVRGYSGGACRAAPDLATGTITATRTSPPMLGPAIAPARSPFSPSAPTFAAAPVVPAPVARAPVVTGTLDTPSAGSMHPASFEGRMAIGAPLPTDAQASEAAPVASALPAPPRVQRPRSAPQQTQRRERAWTGTFFNQ